MNDRASAQRVILLGASNLTYAFPLVLDTLRAAYPHGLEVFAAHGHGRSYGDWSRVLGRGLPGVRQCRLWDDLAAGDPSGVPPRALITDVGNDLLYGVEVGRLLDWVAEALDRLRSHKAQTVVTLLPLSSLERLSAWRFHLTKLCFFPHSRLTYGRMREEVPQLNAGLVSVAQRYDARTVVPADDWYGFDPIHVRRSRRAAAWETILSTWPEIPERFAIVRPSPVRTVAAWTLRPAERRLFGLRQEREQPVLVQEQCRLWLY